MSRTGHIVQPRVLIHLDAVFTPVGMIVGLTQAPFSCYSSARLRLKVGIQKLFKRAARIPDEFTLLPSVGEAHPKLSWV